MGETLIEERNNYSHRITAPIPECVKILCVSHSPSTVSPVLCVGISTTIIVSFIMKEKANALFKIVDLYNLYNHLKFWGRGKKICDFTEILHVKKQK